MRWPGAYRYVRPPAALAAWLAVLLSGCGGELQTPGEALRIFGSRLPEAYLGEEYSAQVSAVGGLRPFTFEVEDGALPPGLVLAAGTIRGVPQETGSFQFTIVVSDANLSRTFQDYTLVVVERPPPTVVLVVPQTEVRERFTARLNLQGAAGVRALSVRLTWDAEAFELVERSVTGAPGNAAFFRQSEPGVLQADLAALGTEWNGDLAVLAFDLVPTGAQTPELSLSARILDDRGGDHFHGDGPEPASAGPNEDAAGAGDESGVPPGDAGEDSPVEVGNGEDIPVDVGEDDNPSVGADDEPPAEVGGNESDEGDTPQDGEADEQPEGGQE